MPREKPTYEIELSLIKQGFQLIAGLDEVGRGPWAGPVVASAVILDSDNIPEGLNDSKKLSEKKREELFEQIYQTAHVGVGQATVSEIDELNILQASFLAMRRALEALPQSADYALVDGNKDPGLKIPTQTVIKGDSLSQSIAAASIIAKVTRDRIMCELAQEFPNFAWESNKGYGTKAHREGLAQVGVTQHHRKSFKPIHNMLC